MKKIACSCLTFLIVAVLMICFWRFHIWLGVVLTWIAGGLLTIAFFGDFTIGKKMAIHEIIVSVSPVLIAGPILLLAGIIATIIEARSRRKAT